MTKQQRYLTGADGVQISMYLYADDHARLVKFCRQKSAEHPEKPAYTVSQGIREAILEKLDREGA